MARQDSYSTAAPADGDHVTGVDVSDTTQNAAGSTKRFLFSDIWTYISGKIGTIGTAAAADTGDFATAAQGALADTAIQPADLGLVATSNDYLELDNLPTLGALAALNTVGSTQIDDASVTIAKIGATGTPTSSTVLYGDGTWGAIAGGGGGGFTQEEIEDFVGAMVGGGSVQTRVTVSYDDVNGELDFVVDNDLSHYSNASSGFAVAADLASTANAKGASLIGIEDSAANFTATNVEAALAELSDAIVGGSGIAWSDPVDADIVPDTDGARDLGSSGVRFGVLHVDSIDLGGTSVDGTTFDLVDSITFVIDGGGSAITTGVWGFLEIPFDCTITQVTLLADQTGSIVIDIWKDTYANFPPTNADSITASAPPTISSAVKAQDATLTGWTTSITAGDILAFNVDSATTVERVTLSLKVALA